MKHLLILICIVLSQLVNAQELHIVKDNLNCTYGIKDDDGNWVVEANYILIEQYNSGYFQVRDEIGIGIFTPKGEQLLPCIHDRIEVSTYNWRILNQYDSYPPNFQTKDIIYFYGLTSDAKLVYNLRGINIGSFGVRSKFDFDSDQSIIAFDEQLRFSRHVDSSGAVLIDSIAGRLAPFKGKAYSFIADNVSGNGSASGNVRLVNRQGELIIDMEMDRALVDSPSRICYTKDKFYGVISMFGDTIIQPKYKRLDGVLGLNAKKAWVIYDTNDRAGIMKNDGSILLEPTYDRIIPIRGINRVENAWMIEKGGLFGILNLDGSTLIPMDYEQIYPVHYYSSVGRSLITKYIGRAKGKQYYLAPQVQDWSPIQFDSIIPISDYNNSYSVSITSGFITKIDGKYGVLNPNGSEFTENKYDVKFESYRTRFLMGEGENLVEYVFSRDQIKMTEWTPCVSDGSLYIYESSANSSCIALQRSPKDGKIIALDVSLQSFQRYGDLLTAMYSGTRRWILFNTKTKKKLPFQNVTSFASNGRKQFVFATGSNHFGVLDIDGNLLVDTIYNNIRLNSYSTKIWATKIVGNRHVSILLDSIGRQVIPNQFDDSFELNKGDQIVSQNHRKGVIDSKSLQWKIRPNHFCLMKMFDDYYYVANEYNKKGIVRTNGKTVLPIVYDSIVLMSMNCQLNGICPENGVKIQWLVWKGNAKYLADQNGKLINSRSALRSLKDKLFFDDDLDFGRDNKYRRFPTLDYSPSLHFLRGLTIDQIRSKRKALWTNSILRAEVLDTINRIWLTQQSNCNQTNYYWQVITIDEKKQAKPLSEKARRSCDCMQSSRYVYGGSLVYQLKSIGAKFVTIDISYQNMNNGWDHLRGQAPPAIPNNQHINIIERNGKAQYVSLKDIFPDDDILMQEFILSLQKRDDLKLQCSSLENMMEMINGSFSLSDEGVHLYLGQYDRYSNSYAELLIPIENLAKLSASKWIVPVLNN